MKRVKYIFITALIATFIFQVKGIAQAPEKIAYQAVVRDGTNLLLANQALGVQITILRDAAAIYVETHSVTTNLNALLSVEVGTGTVVSGQFDTIAWRAGVLYIKADIDPSGGTAYSINGTAELLSMPYALFAKEAENGFSGDFNDLTNVPVFGSETKLEAGSKVTITGTGTASAPYMVNAIVPVSGYEHYIGEQFDGGIIFYIYTGQDGLEYDMVVSLTESDPVTWQDGVFATLATRTWDGEYNTNRFWNVSPAKAWVQSLGPRWYMPAIDELSLLFQNRFQVNMGLEAAGGTLMSIDSDIPGSASSTNNYWSSTEFTASYAWYMSFTTGGIWGTPGVANTKGALRRVRAVKTVPALLGTPYQGGVIAYIFKPTDPGYVAGEIHGLIAPTSDLSTGTTWGCQFTEIPPAGMNPSALGTGAQNTLDILALCAEPGIAARICADYVNPDTGTGVYDDWFLPSQQEMFRLYYNRDLIGGFDDAEVYWTSTEGGSTGAFYINFSTGTSTSFPKTASQPNVRPIRYF